MWARMFCVAALVCGWTACGRAEDTLNAASGERLAASSEQVGVWWTSSGWKIGRDRDLPQTQGKAVVIRAARNEAEAAQLVIRPKAALKGLVITPGVLTGPAGATLPATSVEILEVRYVNVTRPTDKSAVVGDWPDPLPPVEGSLDLEAGKNQPFWVRVHVPRDAKAGLYEGNLKVTAAGLNVAVPLQVEVYDFELPNRMTCVTAFGFNDDLAYRYQGVTDERQKREVLDKYWANYSAHHISTYDLAPLDPIRVTWPDVRPPKSNWLGGRLVKNEKHSGERSLLIFDDRADLNVDASYEPLVAIPEGGLRLRFWYRTAVPDQVFLITLNHHDASGKWISGGNNDMALDGNGQWQEFDSVIKNFPAGAKSVQLRLRAARWTDEGEATGLVWFDDVSLTDAGTDKELIEGGGFEPPELPQVDQDKLQVKFDFTAWDKAMERAVDHYGFNSFRLGIPGMGGGTFHSRSEPELLGFAEDTPHYRAMFSSYCSQIQEHLRTKGWLDEAFVYWFDEPDPKDYAFVNNGFAKLKAAAPDINRMLTEQVEPALLDGPVDSIRWEMLRDGIEDYEYFVILKKLIAAKGDRLDAAKKARYAALLEVPAEVTKDMTTFTKDPGPIEAHRDRVARAIAELSRN